MAVSSRWRAAAPDAVITNARPGRSRDLRSREVRYAITMGIRIACFIGAAFVGGAWRWALLIGAAFLPGIAVVLANAIDRRGERSSPSQTDPAYRPALEREAAPYAAPTIIDHDHDHDHEPAGPAR